MIQPGLCIICTRGGYYPWVRIAWCRPRSDGVTFDLINARVLHRFGSGVHLAVLADRGPASDTQLLEPAKIPEPQFCVVERCLVCNPEAWRDAMPKPEGWDK